MRGRVLAVAVLAWILAGPRLAAAQPAPSAAPSPPATAPAPTQTATPPPVATAPPATTPPTETPAPAASAPAAAAPPAGAPPPALGPGQPAYGYPPYGYPYYPVPYGLPGYAPPPGYPAPPLYYGPPPGYVDPHELPPADPPPREEDEDKNDLPRRSVGMMVSGIVLIGLGSVLTATGIALSSTQRRSEQSSAPIVLMASGGITIAIGIPFTIVGAQKVKRAPHNAELPLVPRAPGGLDAL